MRTGPEPATSASATGALPGPEAFAARFGGQGKLRSVRELYAALSTVASAAVAPDRPDGTAGPDGRDGPEARLQALRGLARWTRGAGAVPIGDPTAATEAPATRRLWLLVEVLEQEPALAAVFRACLGAVLAASRAYQLLEVGLPNTRGLGPETNDRLSRRLLPSVRDPRDLSELAVELFPRRRDVEWLAQVPAPLWARLCALARPAGAALPPLESALDEAIALAAGRVSSLGLTPGIRARSAPEVALKDSPFYQLPRLCDELIAETRAGLKPEMLAPTRARAEACVQACREALSSVLQHLEELGVSIDVVYRIEVMTQNLDRLSALLALLAPELPTLRATLARDLLVVLLNAKRRDRSLQDLAHANLRLMARKVIERAGSTGEHYITVTRREWRGMLASAAGGGFLTAFTAAIKYQIVGAHLPLFVEGFLASCNYAGSFLLMQLLGFTLATKQPSMIAAALAGALKQPGPAGPGGDAPKERDLDALVTQVARITRSQLAAALGNVGVVIPAAIAFDTVWRLRTGQPFLDAHQAEHTLESLHPLRSGTVFFAALTGVFLWLSSVGAGWLENWAVYRRLPEAIAQHRIGRLVGRGTMRWLAARLRHGLSGIGGNVTIGFLLGMMPVIGRFLGVPLEVRHVTLSTGSVTLAALTLGGSPLEHAGFLAAAAGIAVVLMLNFGVSFALALGVAMRAREVERGASRLVGAILRRFFRSPLEFVFPPKG